MPLLMAPEWERRRQSWAGACWREGRGRAHERVLAFQGNKQFFCLWRLFFLFFKLYWLCVSLVHTSPRRVSQTVTPRCVGGCCFPVGLAITDMPRRTKHSSFCLGLAETLLNGKAGSLLRHWYKSLLRCKSRAQTRDMNKTYGVVQPSTCLCNATAGNFVRALSSAQGNKDTANAAITKQLITYFFLSYSVF